METVKLDQPGGFYGDTVMYGFLRLKGVQTRTELHTVLCSINFLISIEICGVVVVAFSATNEVKGSALGIISSLNFRLYNCFLK